jgi:hypothetical protein
MLHGATCDLDSPNSVFIHLFRSDQTKNDEACSLTFVGKEELVIVSAGRCQSHHYYGSKHPEGDDVEVRALAVGKFFVIEGVESEDTLTSLYYIITPHIRKDPK